MLKSLDESDSLLIMRVNSGVVKPVLADAVATAADIVVVVEGEEELDSVSTGWALYAGSADSIVSSVDTAVGASFSGVCSLARILSPKYCAQASS